MTIVSLWLFWSVISICLGVVVWHKTHSGVNVYMIIAISGFHLAGIFVFYGLVNRIPIW
jgi:hypothetical protein